MASPYFEKGGGHIILLLKSSGLQLRSHKLMGGKSTSGQYHFDLQVIHSPDCLKRNSLHVKKKKNLLAHFWEKGYNPL